ncbi:hypothetical protein SAMN05660649_04197 [Desulfotomaculum arcticum]|uniref:Uncharacterized protein n=1 Tax=Desulfotruncus arcticus DSM 17038 TaxID=1121424 RepID=A0A1I2XZQ3_9FIRM|nr:hypothetical protein SAMN05660649_04197 [Desulfotomaculum arcticum] [Desulfotruncus arcticus DSM 17038]
MKWPPLKFQIFIAIKCNCSFAMPKAVKIDMPCFLKLILRFLEFTGKLTDLKSGFLQPDYTGTHINHHKVAKKTTGRRMLCHHGLHIHQRKYFRLAMLFLYRSHILKYKSGCSALIGARTISSTQFQYAVWFFCDASVSGNFEERSAWVTGWCRRPGATPNHNYLLLISFKVPHKHKK